MDNRECAEKAKEIYRTRIRERVEPHEHGKIVAIDLDTGDYFLGESVIEACKNGRQKYPGKVFFCLRVGFRTTHRVGFPAQWRS